MRVCETLGTKLSATLSLLHDRDPACSRGGGGGGQCFMQQATYLKEFCSFINSSYACSACIVVGCDTIEDLYFGDPVARDHCHQV